MKEQIYWLQQVWIFTRQKNPIVMKTCFSEGKLVKQFGNPPLSKRTPPPFQLTPLFLSNFSMTPLFLQISKTRTAPLLSGRRKLWIPSSKLPLKTKWYYSSGYCDNLWGCEQLEKCNTDKYFEINLDIRTQINVP